MTAFFYIAGIVVTVVGLVSFAILSGVLIAVRFFGAVLHFGYIKDEEDDNEQGDQ